MTRTDIGTLLGLAAMWGSSYLFMRLGAGEFGAIPLAGIRAAGAALVLLPLLLLYQGAAKMRTHWRGVALVGLANFALPYALFAWAAQRIPAGSSALFTAATPLFGAVIGWLWLRDRLNATRSAGLALGFAGVLWLVWDKLAAGSSGSFVAALACLLAACLYGFSASFTKRYLGEVPPLALSAGSQGAAALMLALPTAALWPASAPGAHAWMAVAMLAVACSAIPYVLFFRLIGRIGASRTIAVTFMIPAFGVLWGVLFLDELVTPAMVVGCAVILAGTALATGVLSQDHLRRIGARWLTLRRSA